MPNAFSKPPKIYPRQEHQEHIIIFPSIWLAMLRYPNFGVAKPYSTSQDVRYTSHFGRFISALDPIISLVWLASTVEYA